MRWLPSMTAFRGPGVWWWRWRRNPLRRRSDALEAWIVLTVWAATVTGGVLAGTAAAHTVERGLARERAERRPVVALLAEDAPRAAGAGPVWADVRWKGEDGAFHLGQARVAAGTPTGTAVTVWSDRDGFLVTQPATASAAHVRAAMVGLMMGAGAAAVPILGGRIARDGLERRRMAQWDAAWARFGSTWGRKTG
ncbi:Rv1733c family protein [Streptomyces sp. NPDC001635]